MTTGASDSLFTASPKGRCCEKVESFFLHAGLELRQLIHEKSIQRTQNQIGGAFIRVLEIAFLNLVVPGEKQAPLWGWPTARSGLMPFNDGGCH
jgi:hypothetical protein